jgi:hypothetical protein
MNDHDLEATLRRYRPVGPPADLGAHVLAARRTWPWAAAAAALLAVALGARAAVDSVVARIPAVPDPTSQAIAELTERLGGDATARQAVELMLVEQQILRELSREP